MPLMRCTKFSAVRSAVRIPRAGPLTRASASPAANAVPSGTSSVTAIVGSSCLKHSTATAPPDGTLFPMANVAHTTGSTTTSTPATIGAMGQLRGIAIATDGTVYVADGFTSTVSRVRSDGTLATVVAGPQPGEVAGVDVAGGSIAWTATDYASGATTLTIRTKGRKDVVADLSGYEARVNPDGANTYGLPASASQCAKDFTEAATGGPACSGWSRRY